MLQIVSCVVAFCERSVKKLKVNGEWIQQLAREWSFQWYTPKQNVSDWMNESVFIE